MSTCSSKDDQSTKSWGAPSSYVSPTVTWGTLPSSTSSSSYTVIDHNTTWKSPSLIVGSPQGWASNASSPLYPSLGNPPSAGSYGGFPSPPVSSSAGHGSWTQLQLNPLLDSRSPQCLNFDIGALQFMPSNMNVPAVHPPVTFIQLLIVVPPFKWSVNIHVPGSVTVSQIVQQLSEYFQGYENAHDLQKSRVQIPSGYHSPSPSLRDQNHPNGFHSGKRRIDLLGRHRTFRGLSPGPGPNCAWFVHLSDR